MEIDSAAIRYDLLARQFGFHVRIRYNGLVVSRWEMPWVKPVGIIYRPLSLAGWALTLLATGFCIQVFLRIDSRSHSVSDTLYGVFPYWLLTLLWIAGRTSGSRSA